MADRPPFPRPSHAFAQTPHTHLLSPPISLEPQPFSPTTYHQSNPLIHSHITSTCLLYQDIPYPSPPDHLGINRDSIEHSTRKMPTNTPFEHRNESRPSICLHSRKVLKKKRRDTTRYSITILRASQFFFLIVFFTRSKGLQKNTRTKPFLSHHLVNIKIKKNTTKIKQIL